MTIDVVVVESHQHVLEHVHSVIRKRKLFDISWQMLHFDAHPDLACSKVVPAVSCFTPRHLTKQVPMSSENKISVRRFGTKDEGVEDDGNDNDNDNDDDFKNLYEHLDSTSSGIAEWILPLVLAANLRSVIWVKPNFSTQLPLGSHRYKVGAYCNSNSDDDDDHHHGLPRTVPKKTGSNGSVTSFIDLPTTATIKVDWDHPYYIDDDSVVKSNDLLLAQTLDLFVAETQLPRNVIMFQHEQQQQQEIQEQTNIEKTILTTTPSSTATTSTTTTIPWALDICLDYFSCLNPYLIDIDKIDPEITDALVNMMERVHFKKSDVKKTINNQPTNDKCNISHDDTTTTTTTTTTATEEKEDDDCYMKDLTNFLRLIKLLFQNNDKNSNNSHNDTRIMNDDDDDDLIQQLSPYFESQDEARHLTLPLKELLQKHSNNTNDHMGINDKNDKKNVLEDVLDAIPYQYWSMPHSRTSLSDVNLEQSFQNFNELLLQMIHHHRNSDDDDDDDLNDTNNNEVPFIITISRSSLDGFTSNTLVERIQARILKCLNDTFSCRCSTSTSNNSGKKQKNHDGINEQKCQEEYCNLRIVYDYGEWEGSVIS